MKVRELVDQLQQLDPELDVLVARDEEGNGFNPVAEAAIGLARNEGSDRYSEWVTYHPDDLKPGGYYDQDMDAAGYNEVEKNEFFASIQDVVVIWP